MPTKIENRMHVALPGFFLAAPFFLPAIFVLSGILIPISALPLLLFSWVRKMHWVGFAIIANVLILLSAKSQDAAWSALPIWFGMGFGFRYFLRNQKGVTQAFLGALGIAFLVVAVEVLLLKQFGKIWILDWFKSQITQSIEMALQIKNTWITTAVEDLGKDAVVSQVVREAPSIFFIGIILSCWTTLWIASKIMKGFLSKSYWSAVRFPFPLVFVTLVSAAVTLFIEVPTVEWLGATVLKTVLCVHALQGISILTFFFNRLKLNGLIRWIMGTFVVVGATPVVVTLGFFDQWFDFRRKVAL